MKKSHLKSLNNGRFQSKIPESLRFVRYRYAFASEKEEEALNLDEEICQHKMGSRTRSISGNTQVKHNA